MKISLAGGGNHRNRRANQVSEGPSRAKSTGKLDYNIASTCTLSDWYTGVYTH